MHSPGINGEGELREQPPNPGSPGKMAVKTECVCVWHVKIISCIMQPTQNIRAEQTEMLAENQRRMLRYVEMLGSSFASYLLNASSSLMS